MYLVKSLVPGNRTACGQGPYNLTCESVGLRCETVRKGVEMCGCPAGTKRDPYDRHSCREGTSSELKLKFETKVYPGT